MTPTPTNPPDLMACKALVKAFAHADEAMDRVYNYLSALAQRRDGFGEPLSKEENGVYTLLIDVLSAEDGDDEDLPESII